MSAEEDERVRWMLEFMNTPRYRHDVAARAVQSLVTADPMHASHDGDEFDVTISAPKESLDMLALAPNGVARVSLLYLDNVHESYTMCFVLKSTDQSKPAFWVIGRRRDDDENVYDVMVDIAHQVHGLALLPIDSITISRAWSAEDARLPVGRRRVAPPSSHGDAW